MKLDDLFDRLELERTLTAAGTESLALLITGASGIGKSTVINTWSKHVAEDTKTTFVDYELTPSSDGQLSKSGVLITTDKKTITVEDIMADRAKFHVFGDLRLTSHDPVDLTGILRPVNNQFARFIPVELAVLLGSGPGTLVLDEFTNEHRDSMQAASLKILRDHKLGGIPLHNDVMVVALGNSPKQSMLANKLAKPVRSRFVVIDVDPPSLEEWAAYNDKVFGPDGWDHSTLAYLYWKPSDFSPESADDEDFDGVSPPADPRGWSYVARGMHIIKTKFADNPKRTNLFVTDLPAEKLGPVVGASFNAFTNTKIPSFDELVDNPSVISEFKAEQIYLTAVTIGERVKSDPTSVGNAAKIIDYIASSIRKTNGKGTKVSDQEIITIIFAMIPQKVKDGIWTSCGSAAKSLMARIGGQYRK